MYPAIALSTRDAQIAGVTIPQGEQILLMYGSANRDESVFDRPDVLDVTREPGDHIAFGLGPHFCLGASLARLEARAMFEEILTRMPDIEQAGPVERLRSNLINGVKHLPVRFTPTTDNQEDA